MNAFIWYENNISWFWLQYIPAAWCLIIVGISEKTSSFEFQISFQIVQPQQIALDWQVYDLDDDPGHLSPLIISWLSSKLDFISESI